MPHKLLIICGPTATGKTDLAFLLSKRFNGELVCADSRQVYKGMDIGTGKDFILGEKIWLYDIVDPDEDFSASDYCQKAWIVINDIWERKKLPIIVGGTGFYIKAIVDGIDTFGIPENRKLRKNLENKDVFYLQNKLKEINPVRLSKMNNSDRNNPRRLIRAIEIAINKEQLTNNKKNSISFDYLMIGLTADKEILYKKIDERVEKRVKQGIIEEIQKLRKKGYSWDLPAMSALGYRQWQGYFEGKETKEKAIEKWKNAEHQYAKKQFVWFKKDKRIIWYDILTEGFKERINQKMGIWLIK